MLAQSRWNECMWPFRRKPQKTVLRVLVGNEEVCSVDERDVPVEKLLAVELKLRTQSLLRLVDSQGKARSFDLSSAFDEGARFLHMSIRIGPSFGVQPDGVLTANKRDNAGRAFQSGAKALRFQPFVLSESPDKLESTGRGLFHRGLHYSGQVTPGNVSLMCLCDHCERSFRLQSFHAGFSNLAYFYCSGGAHTLTASSYEKDAPPVMGKADRESLARFESLLPACAECGGNFRYLNPLLCPYCRKPYIDFAKYLEEREVEYYGNYLYGTSVQEYSAHTAGAAEPAQD